MKKIIVILCLLVLVGCAKEEQNLAIALSRVYDRYSTEPSNMYYTYLISNRVQAIQDGEIEEIIILNGQGYEKSVTDKDELDKFSKYMKGIELYEGRISPQGDEYALSVKIKGRDPILLNQKDDRFCTYLNYCLSITSDENITDLLGELKGEIRRTLPLDWLDVSVLLESQSDYLEEPTPEYKEGKVISNYGNVNEVRNTLLLSKYINEDFSHFSEIKNTDLLVAGLMNFAYSYSRNYDNNFTGLNGEQLYFEKEPIILSKAIPWYFKIVLENNLVMEGKKRFGEDFVLPQIENETLLVDDIYVSTYHELDHYFTVNLPYEHYFRSTENVYIKKHNETNSKFEIVRFINSYISGGNEPKEVLIDNVGNYYLSDEKDYEKRVESIIEENIVNFDVWEYTVEDEKLISGVKIQEAKQDKELQKLEEDKEDTFFNDGKLVINYNTASALVVNNRRFNEDNYTIKINSNENYHTVLILDKEMKIYFNYLFDKQWTMIEDKQFMLENNINLEKLNQTLENYSSECANRTCIKNIKTNQSPVHSLNPSNQFLITSKKEIGYLLNNDKTLVIFEEGEIQ